MRSLSGKHASVLSVIVLLVCLSMDTVFGQAPLLDNKPPSVGFHKLSSENFRVIYPKGLYDEANRLLNTLETVYEPASRSLGVKPDPTSIILHNRTTIPNGFVTLAPRRSEFFTTSTQNYNFIGVNDWLDLLAIHEFRHVAQYDKAKTGLTNVFYKLFGDNGLAAVTAIAVPQWFWEGDAVAVETALTPGGRGRIPNFDLLYRTNLLTRGAWNFNKEFLGSFKHAIPDHYVTGYLLTTHVRRENGVGVWDEVLEKTYRFPFTPYRFGDKLKQVTGRNVLQSYKDMNEELATLWEAEMPDREVDETTTLIAPYRPEFTNYMYPQVLDNGMIVAMRSGLDYPTQLVAVNRRGEVDKLLTTGPVNDGGMLSSGDNRVVWTEFRFHPRWQRKNYSVVMVYDAKTKELTQLTKKTRYTSAAISPDGETIAAIHANLANRYRLELLDASTGEKLRELTYEGDAFISMPRWSAEGTEEVTLRKADWGKEVVAFNAATGRETILIEATTENIGHPILTDDYLYFNSPLNGVDNIYAKDLSTGETLQVTHRPYAGYNPALSKDGKDLIFNDFTKDGMAISQMALERNAWTSVEVVEDRNIRYYDPLVEGEAMPDVLKTVPRKKYEPEDYRRGANMFKFHSWGPVFTSSQSDIEVGLFSQDLLSTTELGAGYGYDAQEQAGRWFGRVSYQQWFPILDLEGYAANRRINSNIAFDDTVWNRDLEWKEKGFDLGLRVPLLLTGGRYSQSLSLSSYFTYNYITDYNDSIRNFERQSDGNLYGLQHSLTWNHLLRRSVRDIYSPWGQRVSLYYRHNPFGGDFEGSLGAVQAWGYFPGLFKHHHLWLRGGYQYQDVGNYRWSSPVFFPRGYGYTSWEHFGALAFNYALPVWYPDVAIGPLLNIQRIKVNAFYDIGRGTNLYSNSGLITDKAEFVELTDSNSRNYNSFGAELTFDVNLFRTRPIFEFGTRVSMRRSLALGSNKREAVIEFLIGAFSF
ncbi:MAG: hypothetical protein WBH03_14520 [Cyclobacteriaceae bacterium]